MLNFKARKSELNSIPSEMLKPPREIHTTPQKLMYGSEVNVLEKCSVVKRERKRLGLADMLKLAAGAVAVTVTVAVMTPAPVLPDDQPNMSDYTYTIPVKTRTETLTEGSYAFVLDLDTFEKKQAYYKLIADSIFQYLQFYNERGEEFETDPDPNKIISPLFYSENENRVVGNGGSVYERLEFPGLKFCSDIEFNGRLIDCYDFFPNQIDNNVDMSHHASYELNEKLGCNESEVMLENYGSLTYDEILDKITLLCDEYYSEPIQDIVTDYIFESSLNYDRIETLSQLTVSEGSADVVLPEFLDVVRDDNIYGYKTVTIPKGTDYFLVTGSNEYPVDKLMGNNSISIKLDRSSEPVTINFFSFSKYIGEGNIGSYTKTRPGYDNVIANGEGFGFSRSVVFEPKDIGGSAHIYSELGVLSVSSDTVAIIGTTSRVIPIRDEYYLHSLLDEGIYFITNNGDHEVMVIGDLVTEDMYSGYAAELTNSGFQRFVDDLNMPFHFASLLPGESLTISATGSATTLTMPKCCSVTDSSGASYSPTEYRIDLKNGKIKQED